MKELVIDAHTVTDTIVRFIREQVAKEKRDGLVLGLSGGLDSTVVAILAARALGGANVHTLHLFDHDSQQKFKIYAQKTADELGIHFAVRDITGPARERKTRRPVIMHRGPVLSALNRRVLSPVIHLIYRLIFGEGPFVTTLKKGPRTANGLAATIHRALGGAIEEGFNLRHTLRKEILEDYAQERNLLLVGAANRSEAIVGWFVKDGIDDLPVEPIIGLYKTQVRQLAGFLAVPQEIIREHPSPDMAGGMADEDIIGYPYLKIDRVAYATEHGLGEEVISAAGITKTEFENIRALNKLSAWKRRNEHTFPAFP